MTPEAPEQLVLLRKSGINIPTKRGAVSKPPENIKDPKQADLFDRTDAPTLPLTSIPPIPPKRSEELCEYADAVLNNPNIKYSREKFLLVYAAVLLASFEVEPKGNMAARPTLTHRDFKSKSGETKRFQINEQYRESAYLRKNIVRLKRTIRDKTGTYFADYKEVTSNLLKGLQIKPDIEFIRFQNKLLENVVEHIIPAFENTYLYKKSLDRQTSVASSGEQIATLLFGLKLSTTQDQPQQSKPAKSELALQFDNLEKAWFSASFLRSMEQRPLSESANDILTVAVQNEIKITLGRQANSTEKKAWSRMCRWFGESRVKGYKKRQITGV